MKKAFHIFLSLLVLTAMLHISVAIHYCEGKDVAKKVSLSGKLATCGMSCSGKDTPPTVTIFTKNCCSNIVIFCGTSSNYSPAFSFVPELFRHNFQFMAVPSDLSSKCKERNILVYPNSGPPGTFMPSEVDLSRICIIRI